MKLKLTLNAIWNDIGIHIAATVLLAFLFYSEVSLYHYFYKASINHNDSNSSQLAKSSYTFDLSNDVDQEALYTLDKDLSTISSYEDIVIVGQLPLDDLRSDNSEAQFDEDMDVICFYPSMSSIHKFKSSETNETYQSDKSENVVGMRIGDSFEGNTCILNGKEYRIIKSVFGLNSYRNNGWDVMCISGSEFWDIGTNCNRIVVEFNKELSNVQLEEVQGIIQNQISIDNMIIPQKEIDISVNIIEDNILSLAIVFIVMVIATSCILPIIKYCLWKRHYEFSSYRMCGADHSFIRDCEFIQVTIIGLCSILLGIVLSINKLDTEGFIIVLLLSSVLFFIRLLAEVLIDSRSSRNVMEVNKKWKL